MRFALWRNIWGVEILFGEWIQFVDKKGAYQICAILIGHGNSVDF